MAKSYTQKLHFYPAPASGVLGLRRRHLLGAGRVMRAATFKRVTSLMCIRWMLP